MALGKLHREHLVLLVIFQSVLFGIQGRAADSEMIQVTKANLLVCCHLMLHTLNSILIAQVVNRGKSGMISVRG